MSLPLPAKKKARTKIRQRSILSVFDPSGKALKPQLNNDDFFSLNKVKQLVDALSCVGSQEVDYSAEKRSFCF